MPDTQPETMPQKMLDTLCIDTCGGSLTIALGASAAAPDSRDIEFHHEDMIIGHAEAIHPALETLFGRTQDRLGRPFKRIGVTTGPGSFTGLRVGLSVAKAYGLSEGCAVVPINRLAMLARGAQMHSQSTAPVHVCIDARRGEHFVQIFDRTLTALSAPKTWPSDTLDDWRRQAVADTGKPIIVDTADDIPGAVRAQALIWLTQTGQGMTHKTISALYVRAPDAKKPGTTRFRVA
ncbi:MAG: tRNA (adenosine(37)-N6)-threonylcarbamoyltransferase complex dimerization subunit type 1 TsaB [Pseudomonadota bacterium]